MQFHAQSANRVRVGLWTHLENKQTADFSKQAVEFSKQTGKCNTCRKSKQTDVVDVNNVTFNSTSKL